MTIDDMKINVFGIVSAHYRTMYDAERGGTSQLDLVLFLAFPALVGIATYIMLVKVPADFYGVSISFFGIFIALLLNIQVAIFGIFQRRWSQEDDSKLETIKSRDLDLRKTLISELNTNISYLVSFSCLSLVSILIFDAAGLQSGIAVAITAAIYCHFVFTLLMIVKRSHALFQREYSENSDG